MAFELPDLPYPPNALEPHISQETIEYHHGKHHKSYVDKLNTLIKGIEFEKQSLEYIIQKSSGRIFDNAAQHWNHTFYWHCINPNGGGKPSNELVSVFNAAFGSLEKFKELFTNSINNHFGSGWTWLVKNKHRKLEVLSTVNACNPMTDDKKPLLTCDIWEHAYYIDVRNDRPKYVNNFWQVINWDFVLKNFKS